jgi:ribosomal peptide maturation radical SAM protein 1
VARPAAGSAEAASAGSVAEGSDLVFVVMPFADVERPAIGVSLLQPAARAAGWSSAIEYCNIAFAEVIGSELYSTISDGLAPDVLAGEWIFADDVFGDRIPPPEDYVEQVLAGNAPPHLLAHLAEIRAARADYLDACTARILARRPRVVGFTTTFHQTCAALAVARRLKEAAEPPIIVFGGANCEGEMGEQLIASFGWIDYIASGEADRSLPALLDVLLGGSSGPVEGIVTRRPESTAAPASPLLQINQRQRSGPITNLDSLPIPDFDDYFAALRASSLDAEACHLVIETSRGCWWGAKHHCTFCGLNGDTMAFRSKSPQRVFDELEFLADRHGTHQVGVVDNILDMHYIDTLFPMLADSGAQFNLFYEVKANLRYDQLVTMQRGGIRQIQPGIESLSDSVLTLMDKGVSAMQNIALMRWCAELGIQCSWNVLAGFPGEPPEEYARMAEVIPLLVHLDAPMSTARLRLDRFSPFHRDPKHYGFRRVRPSRAYFYVFPLGRREMSRLAYFFDYDYADDRHPEDYLAPVTRAVGTWTRGQRSGERPRLDAEFGTDDLVVTDTRPAAVAERHVLVGVAARVYELCDIARTIPALLRDPSLGRDETELRAVLDSLVTNRLMLTDKGRYLSLAVFRSRRTTESARLATTAAA